MKRDKVIVRALHQFIYLTDDRKYEFIEQDRELEIDVKRAVEWTEQGIVDVLNPHLNDGLDEYVHGYNLYLKVGNATWL